jgi:nucleoside-diphosphate-sugar epimerase
MAKKEVPKKVLVTGGGGFIGSRLVPSLLQLGCRVSVLQHSRRGRLEGVSNSNLEFVGSSDGAQGGMLDKELVRRAVEDVDVVYHLAIQWMPSHHFWKEVGTVADFYDNNLRGTLNLLEASKASGVKHFLYSSSAVVYGMTKFSTVDEETICTPETWDRDPGAAYPIMKLASEKLILYLSRLYSLPVTVYRVGVVFDDNKAILPDPVFIDRILKGESVEVSKGVGRTSIHVDDIADAFILATLNEKAYGQIFNLSNPATFIQDSELYEMIADAAKSKSKVVVSARPKLNPAIESMEKVRRVLGWQPERGLDVLKKAIVSGVPAGKKPQ